MPIILYECDGTQCNPCSGMCSHTHDISHAVNFKHPEHCPDVYVEEPAYTANDYQYDALRTATNTCSKRTQLMDGLMGLNGEAGECIDILKKYLFQGHELDKEHLAEELGDVAWYLAVSADAIGYDLESIFRMNVEKLRDRYPNGFEASRSINRDKSV